MNRVINVDMDCKTKNVTTALNKFFKKYSNVEYWKDTFEYMIENNLDVLSDTNADDWTWTLHLNIEEDYIYVAVIERA